MNLLFICLSDLHLGEEDSLLTNLHPETGQLIFNAPGQCLMALVNYLHALKRNLNEDKRIPYLVLNGDILELATATYPIAVTTFSFFLKQITHRKIFDRIVYLAGNHDHGLWSLMRDSHFLETLHYKPGGDTPDVDHVTPLSSPQEFTILTNLVGRLSADPTPPPVLAANPAFRLQAWTGHDYFFHHGHYLEHLYQALSILRARLFSDQCLSELIKIPLCEKLEQLEKDNWAWLDFVWSGFARSGRTGQIAEAIYELLNQPDGVESMIKRLCVMLSKELNLPCIPESMEREAFRLIIEKVLTYNGKGSSVRHDPASKPFDVTLQDMTSQFLYHYLRVELNDEGNRPSVGKTIFFFGHTHKPFTERLNLLAFGDTRIVNTGGWVVESESVEGSQGYGPVVAIGANDGQNAVVDFKMAAPGAPTTDKPGIWKVDPDKLTEAGYLQEIIWTTAEDRRRKLYLRVKKTKESLNSLNG
ncbi:MAG: hypothetical protein HQK55_05225 [Deltaproteobacteria bacterium]|nr:hypothetical protein [Deltaproteobacteria bacterium]